MNRCDECKFYAPATTENEYMPDGYCHIELPPWVGNRRGFYGVMRDQGCDLGQPVEAHR